MEINTDKNIACEIFGWFGITGFCNKKYDERREVKIVSPKLKKILGATAIAGSAVFVGLNIIAKKEKNDSVYENEPDEKNPFEGKKVVFIEDENDKENADGVKGHLEAVDFSDYKPSMYDKYMKRTLDVILSFGGLVVLSPLYAAIALAIKIEDPGPVLFTQKRMGQNKQYFKLHKFRSMRLDTPHDVPTHQLENPDQYITKVGKFIRAHSLDELPQIWDIFIGNMSVIGPRPGLWNQDLLTAERDKYGANDVKPGLTGWAQINGRDELEIPEKAKLDGEYVQKMGLKMDAKCFFGSVHVFGKDDSVVEGGTGALNDVSSDIELPLIAAINDNVDFTEHKKILIAGAGSYIGESFKKYISTYSNYEVDEIDTIDDDWRKKDFSDYDVLYDVAGIAHVKETDSNRKLYYAVNRDLAVSLAKKAKDEGVKQFIYLSSMSVYGVSEGLITSKTKPNPQNAYGKSKLEAEKQLWKLNAENFTVSIVRPPMVYGYGCKGNYQKLRKCVLKFGMFPIYENKRSMLYVDNLSSAVRGIIHNNKSGLYFPQNIEYVKTLEMVDAIGKLNDRKIIKIPFVQKAIKIASQKNNVCKKVFGNLTYDKSLNVPEEWISVKSNWDTFKSTEQPKRKNIEAEKPLVTILTVSYNSEKTIARTVEAVLNQTYSNIEYIIVDGASNDKTVEIVQSYQKLFDEKEGKTLRILSEPDNGMYDALNKGVKLAHGYLVGQTNADDFYELDAVENMVNLYKENPYDVAWGSIRVLKPSGTSIKHAHIGKIWTTSGWCHPAMFSRREVLLELPYICESMYDDFDFITSAHQQGKKIITIDKVISNFSFGGMSTKKDLKEVKKRVDILYKVYRRHGMSRLYYAQRWCMELAKYILG